MNRPDEQLRQQQAIYRALQIIGGHIGLPILLLFSIFSKTAQRDLTFLNLCFTWIFSSITFSLGLYRLGPATLSIGLATLPFIHSGQECLNQAALVSGAQVMTDTAMCALIVQLWFDFRAAIHGPRSPRQIRWTRATLLAAPYVALLAFSSPALGTLQTGYDLHSLFSQSIVLLSVLIVTLIFDACIIHILYRRWRFFQRTGGKALGVPLSVAFRVVIFCAYRLVVVVYVPFPHMLSLCSVSDHLHGYPHGYIWTWQHERAYGINVLGGLNKHDGITSFTPVWVDMLQAGSTFWPSSCYSGRSTSTHELQLS
ncbi:hypothetical protein JB92DRAFT_2946356 [Gautieria morchelliformis]|nr:hypothetical protein JB92DRAFT_2946356 [Gautieria morchelliformis]